MVKKKFNKKILIIGLAIILLGVSIFIALNYFSEKESFEVNTIFLKLNIPLKEEAVNNIKITNNEEIEQNFNLYFNDLGGLVSLKEKEFRLEPGESKEIKIYFKDYENKVGIYSGQLIIETPVLTKEIPIILGIEDPNRIFEIIQKNIPKYDEIYPGGKLGMEIKIFDIREVASPSIKVKYSIKNFDGEIIWSDEENIIVGESWSKIVPIQKTWPLGDYVFITSVNYEETESIAGYLFSVLKKGEKTTPGNFNFFVIIILVFVVGILILFFYFIKTRDDLLVQLKKQQNKELERNLEFIKNYKSKIKKTSPPKKKIKEIGEIKKKIINKIRTKQKIQRKELKGLKKKGKKTEMKNKLSSWEGQGFKMFETEGEMKKISKENTGKQIKDWKRKGYPLGFLEKK